MSNWVCFLCLPFPRCGLLRQRPKWRRRLKALYDQESVRSHSENGLVPAGPASLLPLAASCNMPPCPGYEAEVGLLSKCAFLVFLFDSRPATWPLFLITCLAHGGFVCSKPGIEVFVAGRRGARAEVCHQV